MIITTVRLVTLTIYTVSRDWHAGMQYVNQNYRLSRTYIYNQATTANELDGIRFDTRNFREFQRDISPKPWMRKCASLAGEQWKFLQTKR